MCAALRSRLLALATLCSMSAACQVDVPSVQPEDPTRGLEQVEAEEPTPKPLVELAAAALDRLAPLDPRLELLFSAVPDDPEPEAIIRASHYWSSNEASHYVWYEALRGLGGTYVGVGTDQNYLLAGWAEAEFLVLMDFDQAIPHLHEVYRLCFAAAETPADFVSMWSDTREEELRRMIQAAHPEDAGPYLEVHRASRQLIWARLRRTARQYRARDIPTFVSDQRQYDHVRTLWANGRVLTLRGDLTGDVTVQALAGALVEAKMPVSVLYLSNAEQYFDYGPAFRRNVIALPYSQRSLVLRTLPSRQHGYVDERELYHYNRQGGPNFVDWMRVSRVRSVGRLLHAKTGTELEGSSTLDRPAEVSDPLPEIAAMSLDRPRSAAR